MQLPTESVAVSQKPGILSDQTGRESKTSDLPAATVGSKRRFRTDIQSLRALAVILVVGNHLWPVRLSGGYVGVDVFFVISGFLITSHLSKELFSSGRVQLRQFYARRARRLLPAAFTVMGVSLFAVWLWLPYTQWTNNAQELIGSAFYVENWVLAAKAVDYSAMNSSATTVQHFWSLSVEEQFYLAWPVGLIGLFAFARHRNWDKRWTLLTGLGLVTASSFGYCVYLTAAAHSEAYFNTLVRVWEFGAGALLALAVTHGLRSLFIRNIISVVGFALILSSAATFDHATSFPGWTALIPVVGTVLVIVSGAAGPSLWHDRLTALKPVQFIGNISYSLYLWHWPLVVVAPFVLGTTLSTASKVGIAIVAVFLAWITKLGIEDRWTIQQHRQAHSRPVVLAVAAGMLALGLASMTLYQHVPARAEAAAAAARIQASGPCAGPQAVDGEECGDPFAVSVHDGNMGKANEYWTLPSDCDTPKDTLSDAHSGGPAVCDFSEGREDAESVWLVGDSHAQQWQPALVKIAREMNWRLKLSYSGGCPLADVAYVGYRGTPADSAMLDKCELWQSNVAEAVERDRPAKVFTSTFAAGEQIDDGSGRSQTEQYEEGFRSFWSRWIQAGATVYPIADPPLNDRVRDVNCVAIKTERPVECRAPRSEALPADPIVRAAQGMEGDPVKLVDMSKYFCDEDFCYGAVGGVAVYFDLDHLNALFTSALASQLRATAGI